MTTDAEIRALDAADPLAPWRDRFDLPDGLIYLDGNSLGVLPKGVAERIGRTVADEWGRDLIRSWGSAGWFDLPLRVGDRIAPLIGAGPGEVAACDSTSVNLFKAVAAALSLRPDRRVIVSEAENFPTDNYILQGLAGLLGGYEIRYVPPGGDPADLLDPSVAALLLTHVNYRTAAQYDLAAVTAAAHQVGALTVWDLSHSTGAVPVDLTAAKADFAVGCSYKYLNGGPGAPAFIWAAPRHCDALRQPLSGWIGHAAPFAFDRDYRPAAGIRKMLCGTPPVLGLVALEAALAIWEGVEMTALRAKSLRLTELFMALVERECAGHGLKIVTPRDPARRGSHVSIACEHGYPVVQALIARGVIGDFRAPDLMRFGFTPLYLSYADVAQAVAHLADILNRQSWRDPGFAVRGAVT